MENNYETLMDKAIQLGATGAKLIRTDQVIFDPRSYLKCRFGCNRWGKYWTCPPNMDISPKDFQEAYDRYHSAVVIRTSDPNVGQEITLRVRQLGNELSRDYQDRTPILVCILKGAYVFLGSERVVDRLFGQGFDALVQTIAEDVRFQLDLPPSLVEAEAGQIAHQLWHEENPDVPKPNCRRISLISKPRKISSREYL